MKVTFDTNIFGPLVAPDQYPNHPQEIELGSIAKHLAARRIEGSISEGSLTLEALDRHVRIDVFFREWASDANSVGSAHPSPIRVSIIGRAFQSGISVLHVPRVALASFVSVPAQSWASDAKYSVQDRQARASSFVRLYPQIGPQQLKALGAALVTLHAIDVSSIKHFPGLPPRKELAWLKGIVAEYDTPRQFSSPERFSRHIRDLIAEWMDVDILASHYGYGHDFFCTLDEAGGTGSDGILHASNRVALAQDHGIRIVSPVELLGLIPKSV
jgi:hypothetical protein